MAASSYVIRPLEANNPECPRNVALVKAGSCREALGKIFNAVSSGNNINAAVWIDGTPAMEEKERLALAGWSRFTGVSSLLPVTMRKPGDFYKLRQLFAKNIYSFSGKEREDASAALRPFEKHIMSRLQALSAQFPDKGIRLVIRGDLLVTKFTTAAGGNPHIDIGEKISYRFIETLAGGATCLVDNEQVDYRGGYDGARMKDGMPVFWQVPEGTLTFLSNAQNSRMPVMHTAPPREVLGDAEVRIVVIYDLVERKRSIWDWIPGFSR